jgi:MoxR-like ATPase
MVMATQNPIEQEGTYPLPEAQLDRFLLYVKIDYPNSQAEQKILQLTRHDLLHGKPTAKQKPLLLQNIIFAAREEVLNLHMSSELEQYIVQIVIATRAAQTYDATLASWIRFGASPRATIALDRCARAHAWLAGRDYVSPEDIHTVAHDILRHRIVLSFMAEAEGITTDQVIDTLLQHIAVP